MIYGYMLDNTIKGIDMDNSPLIRKLREKYVDENEIYVDDIDNKEKPELRQLIKKVIQTKDTLIVRSIGDLSNNLKDLLKTLRFLDTYQIHLISLEEPSYSYKDYYQSLSDFIKIESSWKEFRRIKGIERAKNEGRMGRKSDTTKIEDAIKLYKSKRFTIKDITRITGLSKSSLYRYIKDIDSG